jgi:hypothetical protein
MQLAKTSNDDEPSGLRHHPPAKITISCIPFPWRRFDSGLEKSEQHLQLLQQHYKWKSKPFGVRPEHHADVFASERSQQPLRSHWSESPLARAAALEA